MRTNNLILLAGLSAGTAAAAKSKPKDAILLSQVQSLTLRSNKQTSHRRVSSIPQLKCISTSNPKTCALHSIDVMRCTNQGSSYGSEDIEWSCTASLPPELKLGSTDVICEGYSSPDDPYVLRGSCGVEYRLVLTELGEQKFPEIAKGGGSGGWFSGWGSGSGSHADREPLHNFDDTGKGEQGGSAIGAWLFTALFLGVLFWIVYSAWTQATAPNPNGAGPRRRPTNGWFGGGGGGFDPGWGPGGGGGGGGFFNDSDPPPPYDKYGNSSSQQGGWRPGFWSGVASTAAASYLYNNMNRGDRRQDSRNYYGGGSSSSRGGWGSSAAGPSSSSWGSSSSSPPPSTSSSRYTSTGFGSTNRR